MPEKEIEAMAKDTTGMVIKELDALLPQKQGESSTNKPKEETQSGMSK